MGWLDDKVEEEKERLTEEGYAGVARRKVEAVPKNLDPKRGFKEKVTNKGKNVKGAVHRAGENPKLKDKLKDKSGYSKYGFGPPPDRFQTYDPGTGLLKDDFRLDVGKERDITPMGRLELQRQRSLLNSNISGMYGRNRAGIADAQGQLAARGGLSGGASERIGIQGNRANQSALQDMYGGHQRNMLGIRAQDIGRQIQGDQYNIGNNLSEIEKQYQGNLQGYNIGAKIHSGALMADAIGAGGAGGGGVGGPLGGIFDAWGDFWGTALGTDSGSNLDGGQGNTGSAYSLTQPQSSQPSQNYQANMPMAGGQQNYRQPGMGQPMQQQYQTSLPTAQGRPNPYSSNSGMQG